MKPNNEFTTPENRFFYPVNHGVEHHESLDTTSLPGTENIPGNNHYAIVDTGDSKVYAAELTWSNYNIPADSIVLGIKGQKRNTDSNYLGRPFIDNEDFEHFDSDCQYTPEDNENTSIIVQVDLSRFTQDIADLRFDKKGIAVLPYGTALPNFAETRIPDEKVRYRLLGFINPDDKLVTWHGETGYRTLLVDWCVANQLKQNRLEEALLHEALPQGGHLIGMLSTNEAARAYLEYYDDKHGTSYLPEDDPRFPYSKSRFERLTERDYETYRKLSELAHHFMSNPR